MRVLEHSFFSLTHAVFAPGLPITTEMPVVLVSLTLPSAYLLRALTQQQKSISLMPILIA